MSTQRQLQEKIEQLTLEIAALKESNASVIQLKDQEIAEIKEVIETLEAEKAQIIDGQENQIRDINAQKDQFQNQHAS